MNLATVVDGHDADRIAIYSRGRATTYGALRAQVDGLRGGLAAAGVGLGDRVAIICGTDRFFVVSYLAVLGLGAVAVPLNPASPGPELARELASCGATAAIVDPVGGPHFADVDASSLSVVVSAEGAVAAGLVWEDLATHEPVPVAEMADGDLAVLMFTSGTAGSPRAAMLTHGNLASAIAQNRDAPGRMVGSDVIYNVLPLHHIFGLNAVLGLGLALGATIVLVQRFDPATALDTIAERKVTVIPGAPPMWGAWAHFHEADPLAFSGVRLAISGAAKLPDEVARAFQAKFGIPIREGYGLTEASPVVTSSSGVDPRIGSIGVPVPGVTVRIVDTDGSDVLAGDAGEIWVKGDNVFSGYWNDPQATAAALTPDGWLRTGDVAVVDDDGYVFIVDRAKDLIIVSGFNVYPAEVEEVIAEFPGVAEVAVVGVPHPHTGEAVKAFVVLQPGTSVGEEQIINHCCEELARYKAPTKVLFVDDLPRGLGGKLLRRSLR